MFGVCVCVRACAYVRVRVCVRLRVRVVDVVCHVCVNTLFNVQHSNAVLLKTLYKHVFVRTHHDILK